MKKILISLLIILTFFLIGCDKGKDEYKNPTITLNEGIDTIDVGEVWNDSGCIATDENGVEIECKLIENTIANSEVGNYYVIYEAIDSNGLKARKTRIINVLDLSGPVITLNPGKDTILLGQVWFDKGCTAFDNYDGEVVCEKISGNVKSNKEGTYYIEYKAVDRAGNESYKTRIVWVVRNK